MDRDAGLIACHWCQNQPGALAQTCSRVHTAFCRNVERILLAMDFEFAVASLQGRKGTLRPTRDSRMDKRKCDLEKDLQDGRTFHIAEQSPQSCARQWHNVQLQFVTQLVSLVRQLRIRTEPPETPALFSICRFGAATTQDLCSPEHLNKVCLERLSSHTDSLPHFLREPNAL